MFNLFKNHFSPQFKIGQIYKMNVASRSHTKHPYYVEIVDVGKDYIETSIPGYHSLKIARDSNWDYHIPRMQYIGNNHDATQLIYNQKGLITYKK